MYWLNENSRKFLGNGYLKEGATPEERIREIWDKAEEILEKKWFSDKFYDYMSKWFYSLSSPVWANFGLKRGLPISCFWSYLADNMWSILYTQAEVGMMSKFWGWCSWYFWELRHRWAEIKNNGQSSWAVHFMELFESIIDVISQWSTRRWFFAPYLPVEHPDIMEFLEIGTEGNAIQTMTNGVTVTDKWIQEMINWDPDKRAIRAKIIQRRWEMWYPYILFKDNCNNNTVDVYKDKNMTIHASNMCSEIMLPSDKDTSFVCCLSSINLAKYDEWKDTDAVETMVYFLDAVMGEFIEKIENLNKSDKQENKLAYEFMKRSLKFAKEHRALWVWALWRHSLLQSKMLSFESLEAKELNIEIFKSIKEKAYKASGELAKEYWEPEVLKWYWRRNTTLLAVAPTTSSAFILWQVSQSIEPYLSNCYVKDVAKLKVTIKNPELEKLLESKWENNREMRQKIRDHDWSVQHLEFLSQKEKDVFKTFSEINQMAVINQAADRQEYIDQAQSLNVMINPNIPAKEINHLYIEAWKQWIKTLYYQHSMNAAQQFSQKFVCSGCES